MLPDPTQAPGPVRMTRVPLEKPVALRFRLFRHFVEEVSANISVGGMFLKSTSPRSPGSQFDFEFTLGEDFALVKGRGEVVWVRRQADGPDRPAGMGVRFLELDEESRSIIERLVERYRESGEIPFDLGRELETGGVDRGPRGEEHTEALAVERPPEKRVGRRGSRLRPGGERPRSYPRLVLTALASALVTGLLLMLFQYLYVRPIIRGLEQRVEQLAAESKARLAARRSAASERRGVDESAPAPAEEAAEETLVVAGERPPVRDTLRAWSDAWSEQRFDDYLSFYSRRFRPPDGGTRAAWEAQRRDRILRPRLIQVSVTLLSAEDLEPDRRRVRFTQSYLSDRYSDIVRKSMTLVWEQGGWKILEERIER